MLLGSPEATRNCCSRRRTRRGAVDRLRIRRDCTLTIGAGFGARDCCLQTTALVRQLVQFQSYTGLLNVQLASSLFAEIFRVRATDAGHAVLDVLRLQVFLKL